jgi:hypothetical protein
MSSGSINTQAWILMKSKFSTSTVVRVGSVSLRSERCKIWTGQRILYFMEFNMSRVSQIKRQVNWWSLISIEP